MSSITEPVAWDGSYHNFNLVKVSQYAGINYGWIEEYDLDCIYIRKRNLIPVIIDELKPLFSLKKLGTIYNRQYICYPAYYHQDQWLEDRSFWNYSEYTYAQKRECRKILAFRYLMGLTSINEKSILVRDDQLYDFNDTNLKTFDDQIYVSERITRDWFFEISIEKTVYQLIRQPDTCDTLLLLHIRKATNKIIKKIDKKFLYFSSIIYERLHKILDIIV